MTVVAIDYNNGALNDTTISTAITDIGSNAVDLLITRGSWTISNNITIPRNVRLVFDKGAIFNIDSSKVVTINGDLSTPIQQIFTGSGASSVIFGKGSVPALYTEWWGANSSDANDDTTAFQNAVNAAHASSGIKIKLLSGTYLVSTITLAVNSNLYLAISGQGEHLTIIQKYGASTDSIINLSSSSGIAYWWGGLENLTMYGNGITGVSGLKLTRLAHFAINNLFIYGCTKGIENLGSLVFNINNCNISFNGIGIYNRNDGGVYANDININNTVFQSNATFAIDHGQGSLLNIIGCDIETNGTSGNTSTGGIFIRNTVDDENGYALVNIEKSWFEDNKGNSISTETGGIGGLTLVIKDCNDIIHNDSAGKAIYVQSSIRHFVLENTNVTGGQGAIVNVVSTIYSTIKNAVIDSVTDTSAYKTYYNVQIGGTGYENTYGYLTDVNINLSGGGTGINFVYDSATRNNRIWVDKTTWTNPYLRITPYNNNYCVFDSGVYTSSRGLFVNASDYTDTRLRLGNYYFWVDSSGRLRIKNGAPSSDTDGTVVGTQS